MSLSAFALKKDGTNLYDKIADTLRLFCRRMDRESFNFCVRKNMENKITTSHGTILPDSFPLKRKNTDNGTTWILVEI